MNSELMKRLILAILCCMVGSCYSFAISENSDSISQEERYSGILERMKKIPMLNAVSKYDFGDIKMTIDSIPEANQLLELYLNSIIVFYEQDYEQFNDNIITANKNYVDIADKLAESSAIHFMWLYCNGLICIIHNNTNAGLYYMLMCDQFLAKHDPYSVFRLQTMPSIAEFNYSVGNVENGNSWMSATWDFLEDRKLTKSLFALNFLMTYAERKAIERDNVTVDSLYDTIFDILKELHADDFLVKDMKASYMMLLLQSDRYDELFEYASSLEPELNKHEVQDAEILLFCNVLKVLYAVYYIEDLQEAESYLQKLDALSRWLFTNQMPKLPNEFRVTYWENQIRTYLDILPKFSQLFDSPNFRKMVYNIQLLTNGALLSSNCSFEDIAKKSKNPTLREMYAKFNRNRIELDRLKNTFGQDAYNEKRRLAAEQLSLENDMLKEIKKEGSILDWSNYNVESVQQSLGNRDIAIEFLVADVISDEVDSPVYYAMVIGHAMNPKMIPLFTEDSIANMDSPNVIYNSVWKPILEDEEIRSLKVKNIYFSPSAKLCNIPIENSLYLHPKKCHAFRMSSTRYVVSSQKKNVQKSASLFGGMWYNLDTPPSISGDYDGLYEYLPHTLLEIRNVDNILSKWNCDVKEGAFATESNFKALSGHSPNVLLVATHGIFSDEKGDDNIGMSRTGLLMSGAENAYYKDLQKGEEDGFLFASEIEDLNLSNTDLVVLSGCRTGLGTISSEGVYGLQRGFKRAGVNTIIMSLYDVRDDAAEQFVTSFFERFVKTNDKYKSFDHSIEKIKRLYPDFSVWGSFVMIDGNS